jgi:zinc/manganese transport system permease protein
MISFAAAALPPFTLNLIQDLSDILSYDFARQALLTGTILSVVAGLVGYFAVLRHQAFAGEALSDVAFTGALAGAAFAINPLISLLIVTVGVALAMGLFGERLRGRDVAIGTVLAWTLGLGVLFLSIFTTSASGSGSGFSGITALFGDLFGVSGEQTRVIALAAVAVIAILALIARPLLFSSLDPDVAQARGVPVRGLGLLFMALLGVTVALATLAVGALLVFALLLLPAATAQQIVTRPYVGLGLAALLAILITWVGVAISFYTGFPTSVCVSLLGVALYAGTLGALRLRAALAARRIAARPA